MLLDQKLYSLTSNERHQIVAAISENFLRTFNRHFPTWSHPGQLPPDGDWRTWLIMAGRGFGKTRAGAEWVLGLVRAFDSPPAGGRGWGWACEDTTLATLAPSPNPSRLREGNLHIALVAATIAEARDVMIEGPSGILSIADPRMIAEWAPSRHYLRFTNGAELHLYSGANPEKLRGPQHHFAWCDELAKWKKPEGTWHNLQLGLRMGERPRALVTTTPRGCALLKRIIAAHDTVQTGGSTRANPHLPAAFIEAMEAEYGGTRLGRQELEGELIMDVAGSLWPEALLERCRINPPRNGEGDHAQHGGGGLPSGAAPRLSPPPSSEADASAATSPCRGGYTRIVIGVDPPASESGTCGIIVCGLTPDEHAHVLADCSVSDASPDQWARSVVRAADAWDADRVIAEKNQGGDMVRQVLLSASATLPVELVHASLSKGARAEPVAGLFENGRAFLAGRFPELEAQLGGMTPAGGYQGSGNSPDRADACVWALWALLLKAKAPPPRIRSFDDPRPHWP